MQQTQRLTYLAEKTEDNLNELWSNCFLGKENLDHMNAYVPFPVNEKWQLSGFLKRESGYRTWLIKRKIEQDIIGFAIHGDFIPGLLNNVGFNIGLNYTRSGYATETLRELLRHLKDQGFKETFGHCFETNTASIKVMETCGFVNMGPTGRVFGGIKELKIRVVL